MPRAPPPGSATTSNTFIQCVCSVFRLCKALVSASITFPPRDTRGNAAWPTGVACVSIFGQRYASRHTSRRCLTVEHSPCAWTLSGTAVA
eukprot:2973178-Prymnesium_polylepis.1